MAWEAPVFCIPGLVAGADLSAKQFYFVKITASNTVDVCSDLTDKPIGILQNAPTQGQAAHVMALGVSKMKVGAVGVNAGDSIGTDANGTGAAKVEGTNTTNYVAGVVIEGAAAGAIATVAINCLAPHRAS